MQIYFKRHFFHNLCSLAEVETRNPSNIILLLYETRVHYNNISKLSHGSWHLVTTVITTANSEPLYYALWRLRMSVRAPRTHCAGPTTRGGSTAGRHARSALRLQLGYVPMSNSSSCDLPETLSIRRVVREWGTLFICTVWNGPVPNTQKLNCEHPLHSTSDL